MVTVSKIKAASVPRVERGLLNREAVKLVMFYDHGTVSLLQAGLQAVFLKARENLPKALGMDLLAVLFRSNSLML